MRNNNQVGVFCHLKRSDRYPFANVTYMTLWISSTTVTIDTISAWIFTEFLPQNWSE